MAVKSASVKRTIWCDSKTNSIVWMKEDMVRFLQVIRFHFLLCGLIVILTPERHFLLGVNFLTVEVNRHEQ